MPVRIKPVHDFGPCVLDLDGIKNICALVDKDFPNPKYSAEDDMWEVYDESSANFIDLIQTHKKLDSFVVSATNTSVLNLASQPIQPDKTLKLIFNQYQATLKFTGDESLKRWLNHFFNDLKELIHPPTFRQLINTQKRGGDLEPISLPKTVFITSASAIISGLIDKGISMALTGNSAPYCKIIIQKKEPNQFWNDVKTGLVTNIIWVILGSVGTIILGLIAYFIFIRFGLNVSEWFRLVPTIPTPTIQP